MSYDVREMVHRRRLKGAPSMPSSWRGQFEGLLGAIQAETLARHPEMEEQVAALRGSPVSIDRPIRRLHRNERRPL